MRTLAVAFALMGCRAGNFLTVSVENIPCDTERLDVAFTLEESGATDTTSFMNDAAFGDGSTTFALDLGNHTSGHLDVVVTAVETGGSIQGMGGTSLPASGLEIALAGVGCMRPTDGGGCWADGFDPSNFDPCNIPDPVSFVVQDINTDDGDYTFFNNPPVKLLHFTDMIVGSGDTITVSGALPLLIIVDGGATIDGKIVFENSASSSSFCHDPTPPGVGTPSAGAGGGGGGFAMAGGNGGNTDLGGDAGIGGLQSMMQMLSPLRTGCVGSDGRGMGAVKGGRAGVVPGGIEISAKQTMRIGTQGVLEANGGGAGGGESDGSFNAGGGGGSSGGEILLEAPNLTVAGSVCAVGGGGGAGGNAIGQFHGGTAVGCTMGMPGGTGGNMGGPGAGGDGGGAMGPTNGADEPASGTPVGGGGGGGSEGQIQLRAQTSPSVNGIVVPGPH